MTRIAISVRTSAGLCLCRGRSRTSRWLPVDVSIRAFRLTVEVMFGSYPQGIEFITNQAKQENRYGGERYKKQECRLSSLHDMKTNISCNQSYAITNETDYEIDAGFYFQHEIKGVTIGD